MIRKYGLNIPCHWDRETTIQMLRRPVPQGGLPIIEMYGVLPAAAGNPLAHGRLDCMVPAVRRDEAIAFRNMLRDEGVAFTYLLNAPRLKAPAETFEEYLDWILSELRPDALTIADHELMRRVRAQNDGIDIHISTVAGVRHATDLEMYLDVRPNRVIPINNVGKNWSALTNLANFAKGHGIDTEVLVTESCVDNCQLRAGHFRYVADPSNTSDWRFHRWCQSQKVERPGEFLRAGGAIRPEDMYLLQARGVSIFKISGRDRPAHEMPIVVAAYQDRRFGGNFFELLDITPYLESGWARLLNTALDGFLANYPQGSVKEQQEYCDALMAQLYKRGQFNVRAADYVLRNGRLELRNSATEVVTANLRKAA